MIRAFLGLSPKHNTSKVEEVEEPAPELVGVQALNLLELKKLWDRVDAEIQDARSIIKNLNMSEEVTNAFTRTNSKTQKEALEDEKKRLQQQEELQIKIEDEIAKKEGWAKKYNVQ